MMALLNDEPGADVVEDVLTEPGSPRSAHAPNVYEVYHPCRRCCGAEGRIVRSLVLVVQSGSFSGTTDEKRDGSDSGPTHSEESGGGSDPIHLPRPSKESERGKVIWRGKRPDPSPSPV